MHIPLSVRRVGAVALAGLLLAGTAPAQSDGPPPMNDGRICVGKGDKVKLTVNSPEAGCKTDFFSPFVSNSSVLAFKGKLFGFATKRTYSLEGLEYGTSNFSFNWQVESASGCSGSFGSTTLRADIIYSMADADKEVKSIIKNELKNASTMVSTTSKSTQSVMKELTSQISDATDRPAALGIVESAFLETLMGRHSVYDQSWYAGFMVRDAINTFVNDPDPKGGTSIEQLWMPHMALAGSYSGWDEIGQDTRDIADKGLSGINKAASSFYSAAWGNDAVDLWVAGTNNYIAWTPVEPARGSDSSSLGDPNMPLRILTSWTATNGVGDDSDAYAWVGGLGDEGIDNDVEVSILGTDGFSTSKFTTISGDLWWASFNAMELDGLTPGAGLRFTVEYDNPPNGEDDRHDIYNTYVFTQGFKINF